MTADAPVSVEETPPDKHGIYHFRATVPVEGDRFYGAKSVEVEASYDPFARQLTCNLHGTVSVTAPTLLQGEVAFRRAIDAEVEGVVKDFFHHRDPWKRGLTAIASLSLPNAKD